MNGWSWWDYLSCPVSVNNEIVKMMEKEELEREARGEVA